MLKVKISSTHIHNEMGRLYVDTYHYIEIGLYNARIIHRENGDNELAFALGTAAMDLWA